MIQWRHNKRSWGLKELKEAGFLAHRVPRKEFYNYYWVPGNQTRHPFYFEHLKAVGDELRNNLKKHKSLTVKEEKQTEPSIFYIRV